MPKEYWELTLEYEEKAWQPDTRKIEHLRFLLDPDGRQRAFEANQRLYQQALDRFDAERRLRNAAGGRDGNPEDEYFVVRAPGGWDSRTPGFEEERRGEHGLLYGGVFVAMYSAFFGTLLYVFS
jgi:hypothetical protein